MKVSAIIVGCTTIALAASTSSSAFPSCNNSPTLCNRSYSSIAYLGTHNSPFVSNSSNGYNVAGNQYYDTIMQLNAGVRLLSAQIHWGSNSNELHLCHTLCALYDAGSLESWLASIKAWMDSNSNEVVTLLLVNSANATAPQIGQSYTGSGLSKYAWSPGKKVSQPWPALSSLISANKRLVTFVANMPDNTGATYLLDEFEYIYENPYEVLALANFSCQPDRPSSVKDNPTEAKASGRLFLMNHFLQKSLSPGIYYPDRSQAPIVNSPDSSVQGSLGNSIGACHSLYSQAPNFVLVDWFNIGPSIQAIDALNNVTSPNGRIIPSSASSTQVFLPSSSLGQKNLALSTTSVGLSSRTLPLSWVALVVGCITILICFH
jgi:hypothetical protein